MSRKFKEYMNYKEDKTISVLVSYDSYKKKYPKENKEMYLSRQEYNSIIKMIGEEISYDLIKYGKEIKLPSRIGSLQAMKVYPSKKMIDFHKTNEIYGEYNKSNPNNKKSVKHTNRITKGTIPVLVYSAAARVANFKNKTKYTFVFNRPNIRPNSYNKYNPKISLVPYFKKEGFRFYELYNPFTRIDKKNK